MASVNAALAQKTSDLTAAKADSANLQVQLATARKDVDDATKENGRLANENAEKVAALQATIAQDQSQAQIAAVSMANTTAALTASEQQRKAGGDALASARSEVDRLNHVASDDDIAISDLTNKNDVANRKVTDLSEQVAQSKGDTDRLNGILKEHGINAGEVADTIRSSAPAINGVIRQAGPINGIPYATISVGSAESVQKGMIFNVIDRNKGKFLGELTIDNVDLHEATGKLEGPDIGDVRVGTDVKTQL